MSKGGIIIRLIDIVLLLLFGFLVISEIERKSPVDLPESNVKTRKKPDQKELLIIGILGKNEYYIEGEDLYLNSLRDVKNKIRRREVSLLKEFNRKLKVRIRSNWNLPIKYTMDIAKFCQMEKIAVGMDIESKEK